MGRVSRFSWLILTIVFLPAPPVTAQVSEPYAAAVQRLTTLIEREVRDKKLPALSVALVDNQRVVWSKGFGFQDREKKIPATDQTVYRVGSVSKLFTDVAVMQLVEKGQLDLDAPVTTYLPDFKPAVKAGQKPITLRMLMSHRSGRIREPPVGNYFDPTGPTLAQTVASLNGIPLVYNPGTQIKYSNAAVGVVGLVVQKVIGEAFEKAVETKVLQPLGIVSSSFTPTSAVKKNLADAVMWTYHGREFPAPTFELGMAPAGCMYSTVTDLAKFASCLFAGGGPVLKPETLAAMLKPQFADPDAKEGFGIGFALSELEGKKRIGHGGAIYGFATELAALPSEKLAVIVVSSRDVTNPVMTRIADDGLKLLLAAKAGKELPKLRETQPLPLEEARTLAGHYVSGDRSIDLTASAGRLFVTPNRGGFRTELRAAEKNLMADDALSWGPAAERVDGKLKVGDRIYEKQPDAGPPAAPPAKWLGLIGEYGWDHNTLFIHERHGKLYALIEWVFLYPLKEETEDVYAFPDFGLYHGEKLVFTRDMAGRATKVEAAKVAFERRKIDGENGETFRIKPEKPLAELRKAAHAATPPKEERERKPELVDLATIDKTITFDVRYATDNNFLSTPLYTSAKAFMQKPAAEALGRAHKKLAESGYGLHVYDAYRPWYVTKMFWDATPDKFHDFVADPSKGSRHNRGCAVDLGLYDLKTGKPIEVVSGFDEFSDRAYPDYPGGTSRQRWHRDLLRRAMEAEGFTVYEAEWWHFDYRDWQKYPILNRTFEEIK
ncbi:serine hydrolase [Limnoglobus roseus]|uniref:D-alanyl-D-alanine dipeptidase n=1 Tax=Limnoglobus roseus TaxID=2598579 RepID=A0A5C1AJL4_9BACT|nr:serine hydrolase [Limnoglobus roseus]QEL17334.1 serine hydrolase [Limnoglobus roseus]